MGDALWKRLQLLASVLSVLLLLAAFAGGGLWWYMRGSLPQRDGTRIIPGLTAPVTITRDALGIPTIAGHSREDVARATGFVHAQDRFFQMDLLRRTGAGELAELFGPAALPLDRAHRLHGFRPTARQALARLEPMQRAALDAYAAGVNAGLAALPRTPWEYLLLRSTPAAWRAEDSLLVIFAMWFELQDATGNQELSRRALRDTLGFSAAGFFAPPGTSWDSALDGSSFPPAPLPPGQLRATGENVPTAFLPVPAAPAAGSNSFAVTGAHTTHGGAMLANDMHLQLKVPNTWYRAVLTWIDETDRPHRLVGVTLPGVPVLVAGSNGRIAWGYTNAYVDTADVVVVETETTAGAFYRTPENFKALEDRVELITVQGENPVPFTTRWTVWGPVIGAYEPGQLLALHWNAHDPAATDLGIMELETAGTVAAALAIGRRAGMPNQNLVAVDTTGSIGWTVTGRIPRRIGYDGRYPVSWAYGDRRWDGWLSPDEVPAIINPADGLLWTANQRMIGGEAGAKLGDGGYVNGARGAQIRDGLRRLAADDAKIAPADLLTLQLDDHAVFLGRWQQFLLTTLTDDALAGHAGRRELRDAVRAWDGHAGIDSAAYRLVQGWRDHVAARTLAPFFAPARQHYPGFSSGNLHAEDALWQLTHEQPARLLNPAHTSWADLLQAAADDVLAEADRTGAAPDQMTNGAANTLRMQHPFSRLLPAWLTGLLDMPAQPLPGGDDMPRIQSAGFGASERLVVSPGREDEGLFHMPGGQSGHPLSPYYRAGHDAWVKGEPTPLLPGPTEHTLTLQPPGAESPNAKGSKAK